MEIKDLIIKQEKDLLTYEVRHSVEKIKSLLSDDFKEFGSSGLYYTLNDILTNLPKEKDLSASIDNIEFKMLSDEVALMTYNAIVVEGKSGETKSLRSSIWRNEHGNWKMIFHQGTHCL